MYVCVCNAITEREIRLAIKNGANTLTQLKAQLNVTASCGTCREYVEACLNETLMAELSYSNLLVTI